MCYAGQVAELNGGHLAELEPGQLVFVDVGQDPDARKVSDGVEV